MPRCSGSPLDEPITLVESLSMSITAVLDTYVNENNNGLPVALSLSHYDLKEKQCADLVIREVIHQLESGERVPPAVRHELPDLALLLRELSRFELLDEVLYQRRQSQDEVCY